MKRLATGSRRFQTEKRLSQLPWARTKTGVAGKKCIQCVGRIRHELHAHQLMYDSDSYLVVIRILDIKLTYKSKSYLNTFDLFGTGDNLAMQSKLSPASVYSWDSNIVGKKPSPSTHPYPPYLVPCLHMSAYNGSKEGAILARTPDSRALSGSLQTIQTWHNVLIVLVGLFHFSIAAESAFFSESTYSHFHFPTASVAVETVSLASSSDKTLFDKIFEWTSIPVMHKRDESVLGTNGSR